MRTLRSIIVLILIMSSSYSKSAGVLAASITTNIGGVAACPGEEIIFTCSIQTTSYLYWKITKNRALEEHHTFTQMNAQPGSQHRRNGYTFILVSTTMDHFVSKLSTVARESLHNTVIECKGLISKDKITIKIEDSSAEFPRNLSGTVKEYQNISSTMVFTWNAPSGRVDYFHYELFAVNDGDKYSTASNESVMVLVASNTSNTSVTIPGVPYNQNLSFLLVAHNCIGESTPNVYTFVIVGCDAFELSNSSLLELKSSFSQVLGTELLFSCVINPQIEVNTVCHEDGRWIPTLQSLREQCYNTSDAQKTATEKDYTPKVKNFAVLAENNTNSTINDPYCGTELVFTNPDGIIIFMIVLTANNLGIVLGLAAYVYKLKKQNKILRSELCSKMNQYAEISTGPVYEVIPTVINTYSVSIGSSNIETERNDAYQKTT